MNKKYLTLIKDIFIFALGNVGSKLILFLMVPLYTNYMSTEEYGTTDLVFTVSQLAIPVVSLVIFNGVYRFGLMRTEGRSDVLLCGLTVIGAGSIVTVCITPLFGLYDELSQWEWYLCVYMILSMLDSVVMNYLKISGRNKIYAGISVLRTFITALLNVALLVWGGMGIRGYLLASIGGAAFTSIAAFAAGRLWRELKHARLRKDLLLQMIAYSAPLVLNNISWWAIQSANKLLIELMLGVSVLGVYTVATKIPSLINVITTIFGQAWGLSASREIETTKDTSFYSNVFSIYQMVSFGAAIALIAITKPFMNIYVGEDFQEAWRYVPPLLVSASFYSVGSYFGTMYGALKKSVNNMLSTVLGALINIGVDLLLIPVVGVWGAVAGTVCAYIVIAAVRTVDVLRYIKIKVNIGALVCNGVIALTQAVLVAADIHIYLVSAVAAVLFLFVNRKELLSMLQMAKTKILRK